MTVSQLFKQKRRWNKGSFETGFGPTKSYCMLGALSHCYGRGPAYERARTRVENVVRAICGGQVPMIAGWNDDWKTTIEDVRRVARRARV